MNALFSNNPSATVSSNRILYTPSDFARTSLLHLQEIGDLTALREHISQRSNLQSYLFFTVVSGSGTLNYAGNIYELLPGACVFIDCHNAYSHTTSENLWSLRWCHFYGPTLSFIYEKYVSRGGNSVFYPDDIAPYLNELNQLYDLASGADYIRDMRINEGLNKLLTLIMAESWNPNRVPERAEKRQTVFPVKEYLDTHYAEKISLDFLSEQFYISKHYLTHMFKAQYGVSINAYLLQVRITRAKQLLRFTDKSIEEIGDECGLGAPHYFSQAFKSVEGMPPSEYRKKW